MNTLLYIANREILCNLLSDFPTIQELIKCSVPCLEDSHLFPGETAIVLKCDRRDKALQLADNLETISKQIRGAIPFAEIRIEAIVK